MELQHHPAKPTLDFADAQAHPSEFRAPDAVLQADEDNAPRTEDVNEARELANLQVRNVLQREMQKRQRRRKIFGGMIIAWMLPLVIGVATGQIGPWLTSHPGWFLAYYMVYIVSALQVSGLFSRRSTRKAAAGAVELSDKTSVGALVEVLKFEDRRTFTLTRAALIRLLPQLQASDADLLTTRQRAALCRILNFSADNALFMDVNDLVFRHHNAQADLQVAILKAFEQTGEADCLPVVKRLAGRGGRSAVKKRVQNAANECLPYLRARVEKERNPQTLLRASSAETPAELLLRPAQEHDTSTEQLLRPDTPSEYPFR